jgi:hypothetical protein
MGPDQWPGTYRRPTLIGTVTRWLADGRSATAYGTEMMLLVLPTLPTS